MEMWILAETFSKSPIHADLCIPVRMISPGKAVRDGPATHCVDAVSAASEDQPTALLAGAVFRRRAEGRRFFREQAV